MDQQPFNMFAKISTLRKELKLKVTADGVPDLLRRFAAETFVESWWREEFNAWSDAAAVFQRGDPAVDGRVTVLASKLKVPTRALL